MRTTRTSRSRSASPHDAFASEVADITIHYGLVGITATARVDFAVEDGTLTLPKGSKATRTIDIPILDDAVGEDDETFEVRYGAPSIGSIQQNPATTVVTIVDDDPNATGSPTISGGAQVGKTLTVSTSSIRDPDGLPSTFNYQWVRVDEDGSSNPIDVGTSSSTYTLTSADQGKRIRVEVSFTDDGGMDEELTSDAYPSTGTVVGPKGACPAVHDWCTTLTVEGDEKLVAYEDGKSGSLGEAEFNYGGESFLVWNVFYDSFDPTDPLVFVGIDPAVPFGTAFNFDDTTLTTDADSGNTIGGHSWPPPEGFFWVDGQEITMSVSLGNYPATGAPTISGTAERGQPLTVDTSDIADVDGLTGAVYAYQWIRVDGASEGDIFGATGGTYSPVAADVGKTIKVRASFTDDKGNAEARTSEATAEVALGEVSTVRFGAASYTAVEGVPGALVAVELSPPADAAVTIALTATARGGATSGDWSGVPSSVRFAVGESRKTFTVTAVDDAEVDAGESVRLGFGALPATVTAAHPATATITLADNDDGTAASGVGVSFAGGGGLSANEGGGSAQVAVRLEQAPSAPVTIPLTVTHLNGATAADYQGVPASVTFDRGETKTSFRMRAVNDTDDDDDDERVRLGFGQLPAGYRVGCVATQTVNLVDDDGTSTWYLHFGEASYTAAEGGAGAEVAVLLSEPWKPWLDSSLTVTLQTPRPGGGATAADWSGVPSSVMFAPGETRATFTVTATDDTEDDDGESVELSFGSLPEDLRVDRGPRSTRVRLADDDGDRSVSVRFGASTYTAAEGGAAATVSVLLSAAPGRSVTIPLTKTESGASPADYSGVPADVTFGPNETQKTFPVTATDDAEDDDLESVRLGLGALPSGVSAGSPAAAVVNLTDDDSAQEMLTVAFDADPSVTRQLREGVGYWMGLTLDKAPTNAVTIPLTVTHLGGASAGDYSGLPASVTFDAGETRTGVRLRGTDDAEDDDGEGLRVEFGALPAGVEAHSRLSSASFDIVDNDGPPGVSIADTSVREGAEYLVFTVRLERRAEEEIRVDYTTVDGTATAGADYEATTGTVVFRKGQNERRLGVTVLDDAHDEGTETMTVVLYNPSGAYLIDGTATGRIHNTDAMPRAFLGRFGRTAAVQVVEQVEARMRARRAPGVRARFAGRELRRGMGRDVAQGLLNQLTGLAGADARGAAGADPAGMPPVAGLGVAAPFRTPGIAGGAGLGGMAAAALWGRETMAGLAGRGAAPGKGLEAGLGYGLPVGSRLVGTPTFGVGASELGRDYRLGYSLATLQRGAMSFEMGVDAKRRESPVTSGPEHGVMGRVRARW